MCACAVVYGGGECCSAYSRLSLYILIVADVVVYIIDCCHQLCVFGGCCCACMCSMV